MGGSAGNGAPEGADSKHAAEGRPSPALFQASAGPPSGGSGGSGGSRGSRAAVITGIVLLGAGALVGFRALVKREPPTTAAEAAPARVAPTPVSVPEGATVKVPAGKLSLGSADGDPDEKPIVEVTVAAFDLDATEVTVAAFARCVGAGKCSEPDTGMYCNWHKDGRERHPVNCVDLEQATAYCAFAGRRLPTEEEWEYAARGPDGRKFPWGPGAPAAQLCWNGDGSDLGRGERQGTCPVASYPAGLSPFGAFDMAGNVWEWTASAHCPYDHRGCSAPTRVIRGGAWNNVLPAYVRAQDRAEETSASRRDNVGFRCAGAPT
jgi:formylglycine-generating enzyme required for sulfatase activity